MTEMDSSLAIDDDNAPHICGETRKRKLTETETETEAEAETESSHLPDDAAPSPAPVANEKKVESSFLEKEKEVKKPSDDIGGGEVDDELELLYSLVETEEEREERIKRMGITVRDPEESLKEILDEDLNDYLQGRTKEEADKAWGEYIKQAIDSQGFDINVWPGCSTQAFYFPYDYFKSDPMLYGMVKDMVTHALKSYQDEDGKSYELEDVDKVNGSANRMFYITFKGKNADGDVKVFQTQVFHNVGDYKVEVFRLKPTT